MAAENAHLSVVDLSTMAPGSRLPVYGVTTDEVEAALRSLESSCGPPVDVTPERDRDLVMRFSRLGTVLFAIGIAVWFLEVGSRIWPALVLGAEGVWFLVGLGCLGLGYVVSDRAERLRQPTADELLRGDRRRPILWLRSFEDDELRVDFRQTVPSYPLGWVTGRADNPHGSGQQRLEEALVRDLRRLGPVTVVGRPGDWPRAPGAAPEYLSDDTWREHVVQRMGEAALIVVVPGRTGGVAWEVEQIIGGGHLGKCLFVFPPLADDAAREARWDAFCAQHAGAAWTEERSLVDARHLLAVHVRPGGAAVAFVYRYRDDPRRWYQQGLRLALYGALCHDWTPEGAPAQVGVLPSTG